MSCEARGHADSPHGYSGASGDYAQAASSLALAANTMRESPGAMQLRTLQTLDALGPTASNTVVIALPMNLIEAIDTVKNAVAARSA